MGFKCHAKLFGRERINYFFFRNDWLLCVIGGSSWNSFQCYWEGQLRVMEARMYQPFKCMGYCSELCTLVVRLLRLKFGTMNIQWFNDNRKNITKRLR